MYSKSNHILFFSRIQLVSIQNVCVFFFPQNAGILQPIDSRLVKEIHANAGVICDVHEMRRCLNRLVQSEIFDKNYWPPKSNKRFYPRLKTIRSHMVEAIKKLRYSKIDQECLIKKTEQWREESPEDHQKGQQLQKMLVSFRILLMNPEGGPLRQLLTTKSR